MSRKGAKSTQKTFLGEGRRGSHEQGSGRDLIQVFLKTWRLTLNLIVTIPGDAVIVHETLKGCAITMTNVSNTLKLIFWPLMFGWNNEPI